jgi:hypothetical protein
LKICCYCARKATIFIRLLEDGMEIVGVPYHLPPEEQWIQLCAGCVKKEMDRLKQLYESKDDYSVVVRNLKTKEKPT